MIDYYTIYDKLSDERLANGVVADKLSKFEPYDDMFTTTTYMTKNFKSFSPSEDEILAEIALTGQRADTILLDEYLAIFKKIILQKIRKSSCRHSYYSMLVQAALNESAPQRA